VLQKCTGAKRQKKGGLERFRPSHHVVQQWSVPVLMSKLEFAQLKECADDLDVFTTVSLAMRQVILPLCIDHSLQTKRYSWWSSPFPVY
jgi:hypothetical protein